MSPSGKRNEGLLKLDGRAKKLGALPSSFLPTLSPPQNHPPLFPPLPPPIDNHNNQALPLPIWANRIVIMQALFLFVNLFLLQTTTMILPSSCSIPLPTNGRPANKEEQYQAEGGVSINQWHCEQAVSV